MKKIISFTFSIALALVAMSQSIELRFSGILNTVGYVRADSVVVMNTNRAWSETLIYPDTILILNNIGINEPENGVASMEVYPNPLKGRATMAVQLTENGPVSISIHDLTGRQVAGFSDNMESGAYKFDIKLQKRQMYVLTVATKQGQRTLKLFNAQAGDNNSIALNGKSKSFEKRVSSYPFQLGDILRIKGYAIYHGETLESYNIEYTINASDNISLLFSRHPDGVLTGRFSVSPTTKVLFSQGNLQWSATGTHAVAGGGTAPGTWRFAFNQWDYVGDSRLGTVYVGNTKCDNSRISSTYTGWIDMFGWGTSGYNNQPPYKTSIVDSSYCTGNIDITNTNYDWGVYNAISNGGNAPGLWRALTRDEMSYLVNTRPSGAVVNGTTNARYTMATLNGIKGVIIFPDSAKITMPDVQWGAINDTSNFLTVVNISQWYYMENMGCVFLPAAGQRLNTIMTHPNEYGTYWASTSFSDSTSVHFHFAGYGPGQNFIRSSFHTPCDNHRRQGISVRLVKEVR